LTRQPSITSPTAAIVTLGCGVDLGDGGAGVEAGAGGGVAVVSGGGSGTGSGDGTSSARPEAAGTSANALVISSATAPWMIRIVQIDSGTRTSGSRRANGEPLTF